MKCTEVGRLDAQPRASLMMHKIEVSALVPSQEDVANGHGG